MDAGLAPPVDLAQNGAFVDAAAAPLVNEGAAAAAAPLVNEGAAAAQRVDRYLPAVQEYLLERFEEDGGYYERENIVADFNALLIKYGALVAGGSLLNAIHKFRPAKFGDMDIYVPVKNFGRFTTEFNSTIFGAELYKTYEASLYCSSFLHRNGIKRVSSYATTIDDEEEEERNNGPTRVSYDIMSIRTKRSPLAVVNNFDLTFCQIWYDGVSVYASHPEHIDAKRGVLQGDYTKMFLRQNKFLRERVKKYRKRGFEIVFDPSVVVGLNMDDLLNRTNVCPPTHLAETKRVDSPDFIKHWFQRIVLKWITGIRGTYTKFKPRRRAEDKDPIMLVPLDPIRWAAAGIMEKSEDYRWRGKDMESRHDGVFNNDEYDSEDDYNVTSLGLITAENWKANTVDADVLEAAMAVQARIDADTAALPPGGRRPVTAGEYDTLKKALLHTELSQGQVPNELLYYRSTNKLLKTVIIPMECGHRRGPMEPNLGRLIEKLKRDIKERREAAPSLWRRKSLMRAKGFLTPLLKYAKYLEEACLRVGEDSNGLEGPLYDIHNHPLEAGITRESIEHYLTDYIGAGDKDNIPCYYKPELENMGAHRGAPPSARNCHHNLTMKEVRYMVSDSFWKKYSKDRPIKTGLSEIIGLYDMTLSNTKSADEQYGDIYHATMCPFCLQADRREEGCAYMGHKNEDGRPVSEHPYCKNELVVQSIKDKYVAAYAAIEPDVPAHIEWCVECGRPSAGHRHFDLNEPPGLLPYVFAYEAVARVPNPDVEGEDMPEPLRMVNDPANPGQQMIDPTQEVRRFIDYGKCNGGGRPEMYARMLAVRRIYRDMGIDNPNEERATAALAADEAANDEDLMREGTAIYAQELAGRHWTNAPLPEEKVYVEPAEAEEEDAYDENDDSHDDDIGNDNDNSDSNSSSNSSNSENNDDDAADAADEDSPAARIRSILSDLGLAIHDAVLIGLEQDGVDEWNDHVRLGIRTELERPYDQITMYIPAVKLAIRAWLQFSRDDANDHTAAVLKDLVIRSIRAGAQIGPGDLPFLDNDEDIQRVVNLIVEAGPADEDFDGLGPLAEAQRLEAANAAAAAAVPEVVPAAAVPGGVPAAAVPGGVAAAAVPGGVAAAAVPGGVAAAAVPGGVAAAAAQARRARIDRQLEGGGVQQTKKARSYKNRTLRKH